VVRRLATAASPPGAWPSGRQVLDLRGMGIAAWSRKTLATEAPAATLLVRLVVGAVFLAEGIQKFLYPAALGVGRFAKIGIPWPTASAPFVGVFEIGGGGLVLLGLATRWAAVPLIIDMLVAIATTKLPMLAKSGFWSMAHEARTDWSMLLGALFLLIVGGGPWSLDARLRRRWSGRA
jgi:putative oxidoreductase